MRLGEGLFDTQLTAQNYLNLLMAHHLAFRGFVRVTSFGRFSDLDWALDTTSF